MRVTPHRLKKITQFSRACGGALLGGLLACAAATAQPLRQPTPQPEYQFDRWTTDDGLPQNAVNAIVQTRDGYLWLATFDGLARFDGMQFIVFNKGNTRGIGGNRFTALLEDRQGALWAVTDESWLVTYQAGVFTTYKPNGGGLPWLVDQIQEDEAGNLEIVSRHGIAKWKDRRFIPHALEPPPIKSAILNFRLAGVNKLAWLGADALYVYWRGRVRSFSIRSGLPSLNITSVFEDQRGTIWIGTTNAGLVKVRDGRITVHSVKDGLPVSAPALEDRKGNIWIASVDGWLGRLKDGRITSHTSSPGLRSSGIQSFYEDREGNFWIGTSEGLYRAREAAITVLTRRDGLSSDNIYSIYEDRAGQLWFGTWGGGVTKFKKGCTEHYRAKESLDLNLVTTLYEDRDGYMWIGTTRKLYRLKPDVLSDCNLHSLDERNAHPDPKGFFNSEVWAIHQDRAGRFWFGASNGLIKLEDGRYTRYTTAGGLAGNDIRTILEDRAGRLWFGAWGGLSRYADGRFTSYTEQDGLASDHIRTLYEDDDGVLWIGTYDGGLTRFKEGRFIRYTVKDGLFNNGVFQILEDGRGYFWMSSNKGIHRVSRRELNDFADGRIRSITSVAYGKQDGMLNVECNGGRQPAGWKTRDGRLWFPTAQGAVVIDPSRVEISERPPPVVIEEFRLNNEAAPLSEVMVIPPEKNENIEIRYQGLSFIRPEQQRFKYRLWGVDHDWIEVGIRRAAYYNHLPPGEYTFTALAANSEGVWNMQGASVRLKILPWFWQTWWFKAAVLAGILALALLVILRRIARLKREQAMRDAHARQLIDAQERDRKRIAGDLHDGAGQLVNLISHYALDGLEEPDNYELVTERFAKIASLADKTTEEMRSAAYNLRPPEIDRLGLTRAIESLVDRFNRLPAIEFTRDLDQIDSAFDDDGKAHLYRIVQESLNNIVHHSQATKASLIIKLEAKAVRIEINDNGRGFDASANGNHPGLGLPGIAERARLLGGKAEIRSAPGRGARITVLINLPEEKL
jgi:signal transduction histidine kinase/ligand-binding sensor domain-containing protein